MTDPIEQAADEFVNNEPSADDLNAQLLGVLIKHVATLEAEVEALRTKHGSGEPVSPEAVAARIDAIASELRTEAPTSYVSGDDLTDGASAKSSVG